MNPITFTSVLGPKHRRELEKLLFLNPGQHRVRAAILEAISQYGVPKVIEEHGRLRVRLSTGREVQTLFALSHARLTPRLTGVMVYTRLDTHTILLLHMAVNEEYASRGKFGRERLALRLVEQLRAIARQVKGVQVIRLILGGGKVWDSAL